MRHFLLLTLLGAAPAFGQGADDCSSAQPLAGPGFYAFDNTAATTDGQPLPACSATGSADIESDVWFVFTAQASSMHTVTLCDLGNTVDAKVAVYEGNCTGLVLGCEDDTCGLAPRLSFFTTAGQTYHVRVGSKPGAAPGTGSLRLLDGLPLRDPASGHFYLAVDAQVTWTQAEADAAAMQWQGQAGHLATFESQAELDWVMQSVAPSRSWIGLFQNLSSPSYAEPDGGWEWVTGEPFAFQAWAPGQPNDSSVNGRVEHFGELLVDGTWNDATNLSQDPVQFLVEWDTGIGSTYCSANPNSTGVAGTITASGSGLSADNDFVLEANNLPPNSFGYFIGSTTNGFFMNPGGSQGNLCLGGTIARFAQQVQNSGPGGTFAIQVDLTAIPQPTGVPIPVQPGDTWHFQAWHRDAVQGMATSNFTDGTRVPFS